MHHKKGNEAAWEKGWNWEMEQRDWLARLEVRASGAQAWLRWRGFDVSGDAGRLLQPLITQLGDYLGTHNPGVWRQGSVNARR
jgi:hypothetical protein